MNNKSDSRNCIHTDKAPAVGPYSQAVTFGELVFTSGQIALTPPGELITSSIENQTIQVLENLKQVLKSCGSDFSAVLKTTVYLTNLKDFDAVNKIYASYFESSPPARSCVEVSALPKGASIEIEAVAVKTAL